MSEFGMDKASPSPSPSAEGSTFGFGDLSDAPTVAEASPPALEAGEYVLELKEVSDKGLTKTGRSDLGFRFEEVETHSGVFFDVYGSVSAEGVDEPNKGVNHPMVRARVAAILKALDLPLNLSRYNSVGEVASAFGPAVGRRIKAKLKKVSQAGYADKNEIVDAVKG